MSHSTNAWPFLDPPNTAVFTNIRILQDNEWVHFVAHDEDDGAWQFHPVEFSNSYREAAVVSLRSMLEREPRIAELADLPLGWCARRENPHAPWKREPLADSDDDENGE